MPFRNERRYGDLSTVESQRNEIIPEEFPEGPYGSANSFAIEGKSDPWREDQRRISAYAYENRRLHEEMERAYPPDHEPVDTHEDQPLV